MKGEGTLHTQPADLSFSARACTYNVEVFLEKTAIAPKFGTFPRNLGGM